MNTNRDINLIIIFIDSTKNFIEYTDGLYICKKNPLREGDREGLERFTVRALCMRANSFSPTILYTACFCQLFNAPLSIHFAIESITAVESGVLLNGILGETSPFRIFIRMLLELLLGSTRLKDGKRAL